MVEIVLITAGTGGRKLLAGFVRLLGQEAISVIANTGDDFEHLGLHISPDVDSIIYQLSGTLDEVRGWGRSCDTFSCLNEVGRLGGETWFQLGDRDLATHILRTALLHQGLSLTDVTANLTTHFGVKSRIFPMSNDRVQTRIVTDEREMTFNEYLVKERALPKVRHIHYEGSETARPSPGVVGAISSADLVVIGPSNPMAGIGPILSIRLIRDSLRRWREKVFAVSPIIRGEAVSGPTEKLMKAEGIEPSVRGIAGLYSEITSRIFIHPTDSRYMGMESESRLILADIIMKNHNDAQRTASEIMKEWGRGP